jgi:hypothetical protein
MGNITWQKRYHEHSQHLGSGSQNWTTPNAYMAIPRGQQNKANRSSKENTTANGQQQRSFSPRRLLKYERSRLPTAQPSAQASAIPIAKNNSKRNSKKSICYSNRPENEIKLHPRGQSITTSVHNCPPLGQGKLNATTHGSRRDTRHLRHPMDKNGRHRARSSKYR